MTKLSRRDADRRIRQLEGQRDQALRVMRLWVYLSLGAVLTLLFTSLGWGLLYLGLFVAWSLVTILILRRAAADR